jgi:hypothetical protein
MLRAEGGKRKRALLEWIQDFHAGATEVGQIPERLGMTAQQVGSAVFKWCNQEIRR